MFFVLFYGILSSMKVHHAIKHALIAHEHNEYKPHILREAGVIAVLSIGIFLLGFSAGSSYFLHKTVLGASVIASVLVDLTNDTRLAYNETALVPNEKLAAAARMKGEDMATKSYFAHDSPEGVTPWHWFKEVGYTFVYAGENLAVNFTESVDVQNAWLNSPLHKANILNAHFREIGIATVEGIYKEKPTTFVVQLFGTPAVAELNQGAVLASSGKTTENTPLVRSSPTEEATTTGSVMGESLEKATTSLDVYHNGPIAIARNNDGLEAVSEVKGEHITYSTWYGRLLFGSATYVDLIYRCIILVLMISVSSILILEYKKQHRKHVLYGLGLLVILAIFFVLNRGFIW